MKKKKTKIKKSVIKLGIFDKQKDEKKKKKICLQYKKLLKAALLVKRSK